MRIEFNRQVIAFFQYAALLEQQRLAYWMCGNIDDDSDCKEWNSHRDCLYVNGPILGMIREKNVQIIELLQENISDKLYDDVIELLYHYKECIERRTMQLVNKYTQCMGDSSSKNAIVENLKMLKYPRLCKDNIIDYVSNYNYLLLQDVENLEQEKQIKYLYLYLGYDYYKECYCSIIVKEQPNIKKLYSNLSDPNYRKYGLIPVDNIRLLKEGVPWRIYDSQNDKTIFLKTNGKIVKVLHELLAKGKIGRLAFRGCDDQIFPGEIDISYLMEEVEYGKVFYLNLSILPDVTKMYSQNYNDQLWVIVDHKHGEMKFEELCDDISVQNGAVVTQLVHLMYKEIYGRVMVTHLDHEFLFYDTENYFKRLDDASVKGDFYHRIKTFKIDESTIEFDYPCKMSKITNEELNDIEVPFIYFILNNCFKNRDLIEEYFTDILHGQT